MDPRPIASTSALPPVEVPSEGSSSQLARRYLLEPTNVTPSPLSGTRDLITLFNLDSLYDTFLRPYLPPTTTTTSTSLPVNADSPGGGRVKGTVSIKGKERQAPPPSAVGSPAPLQPYAVASPAPGGGGGFKITLGGIKLNSSTSYNSAGGGGGTNAATNAPPATGTGKLKRVKMEKNYSHMIQDVLGRNSIKKDQYLSHLVLNPDPTPCPPLVGPDAQLVREALTLKVGGLAGFDMTVWENGPIDGPGGGTEGGKKKKKRKQQAAQGGTGDGGGGGSDRKKQRQQ